MFIQEMNIENKIYLNECFPEVVNENTSFFLLLTVRSARFLATLTQQGASRKEPIDLAIESLDCTEVFETDKIDDRFHPPIII